jgi:hypothetical protein
MPLTSCRGTPNPLKCHSALLGGLSANRKLFRLLAINRLITSNRVGRDCECNGLLSPVIWGLGSKLTESQRTRPPKSESESQ